MKGKVGKQIKKNEQKVGSRSVALTKTRKGSADVAWVKKKTDQKELVKDFEPIDNFGKCTGWQRFALSRCFCF